MTAAVVGAVVAIVGTLAGVALGYAMGYADRRNRLEPARRDVPDLAHLVLDAGGYVTVRVDRATMSYPEVGSYVSLTACTPGAVAAMRRRA